MKNCGICSHQERAAIDAALVDGTSLRAIAGQYGTTKSALDRHRKHIPAALVKAKEAAEVADAGTLLSRVERLMSRMEGICDKATQQQEWAGAVGAARELRCCLELLGKLSGELKPDIAKIKNINIQAEASEVRDVKQKLLAKLGFAGSHVPKALLH